ncbi:MAG: hypothetical protein ACOC2M_04030 [bacterium]
MQINSNIKKNLKVALYTSPLIGILAITPMFMLRNVSYNIYPRYVLSISLIIFFAWMINIFILYYFEEFEYRKKPSNILRYFVSYVLSSGFILFAIRMRKIFFSAIDMHAR